MVLPIPVLDDRNFDQLLAEAKRRISVHTPEWTNFDGESDPGITLVELFAFLTDNLLYRANRVPELNRAKFLQLLDVAITPAAAAQGVVTISNQRGPAEAVPLEQGVIVAAGNLNFVTRDGVTVLPIEAQVYYKGKIDEDPSTLDDLNAQFEAVRLAIEAAGQDSSNPAPVELAFYEPALMVQPESGAPNPVLDLVNDTLDGALYLAILAPKTMAVDDVRTAIANEVLSIGISPALDATVPPLPARAANPATEPVRHLYYEIANFDSTTGGVGYSRLTMVQEPDILNLTGIVQVQLPDASQIGTRQQDDPMQEGVEDLPPPIEDQQVLDRLVCWLRLRLAPDTSGPSAPAARLTWAGVNASRVSQAVSVVGEPVGSGTGDPDQELALAHAPVLPDSMLVVVEGDDGTGELWRMTDDLFAAAVDEKVFSLDPAAGLIRFGSGLHGLRPAYTRRIFASYEYGGGIEGNVGIGAIKSSPDVRIGGFKIENPIPTWGGDTGESVDDAQRNIPLLVRHRERLVTEQDFHDVTVGTPGVDVGRVDVLPLFKPDSTNDAPGVVTLMVVPHYDALRPRWPAPDRLFLQTVCSYLDDRRLITTEIYVRGPDYQDVYLTLGIKTRAGYFPDVVRQDVRARMYEYLSSLPFGGPDGDGWPLRKKLDTRDLEAVATRVAGVEFVDSIHLGVGSSNDVDNFTLSGLQLPLLKGISVVEGEAEPLSSIIAGGSTAPAATRSVPVPVKRAVC